MFSGERWALTGEAGLFLDPFYSPGSDFIAIANTYICELVARDRAGRPLEAHAQLYDQIFHSFYESTLALYTDQYPIFGDPEVLPVKVIWDYTYYWGVLSQFFFQRRLADLAALADAARRAGALPGAQPRGAGAAARVVGGAAARSVPNPAVMLDQASLPWFAALNKSLLDRLDDAAFRERIRALDAADAHAWPRRSPSAPRRAPASPRRRCAACWRRRSAAPSAAGDAAASRCCSPTAAARRCRRGSRA